MTDARFDDDYDPSDFILAEQRRATVGALTSLEDDPERATRAIQLAQATGAEPAIVYGNLDNFETQHKAALTAQLLNNNEFLREWINRNPLADKIANDDYGQLDAISAAVQKHNQNSLLVQGLKGFGEGFREGYGPGGVGSWINAKDIEEHRLVASIYSVLGMPIEGFLRIGTGAVYGVGEAVGRVYRTAGGNEAESRRLTRDIIAGLQVASPELARIPEISAAVDVARQMRPYLEASREPPVGLHPILDEAKIEQAKLDVDNLSEALKEAQKSAVRERSPDMFADYIRGITDGEIGISADAVRKLYGEKLPLPDDGVLGWIPDLERKLAIAEATGGDVRVPLADWLAKVDPGVAKQLQDHIRARPESVTLEEAKILGEREPIEPTGAVVEDTRQLHGLQGFESPRFTLERVDQNGDKHAFAIRDLSGADVGTIYIAEEKGGKRLYVDDIQSAQGARSLGPRAMREVLTQIKEAFPNAEILEGMRVTGARARVEDPKQLKTKIDLTKIKPKAPKPKQLELDVSRLEDKEIFERASAIGMTVDQYNRYQRLIEQRRAEDLAAQTKRATEDARRRQSAEWKAAEAEIRPEVADEVNSRPVFAADNYIRDGILYGERVGTVKIREEFLTPEQKAILPKHYYAIRGMHPDDIATLVGFPSGADMIIHLTALVEERKASGLGPEPFRRQVIAQEVERRLREKLGDPEQSILEDVKERVFSGTQLDLLHEETLALAAQAGAEFSFTKEQLKGWINERIAETTLKDVSSDRFLADAGRAGRDAEMALLKGDPAEAFRQKQRQYIAMGMGQEAKIIEKEQARFEKLAKKYVKREVKNVEQAYTNYIQSLLSQAGIRLRVLPDEIAAAIQHEGYTSFADFVEDKKQMGWEPIISDELLASRVKPLDQMSVAEFRDLKAAVDSLDHIGREERKIEVFGEKLDWEEYRSQVISNLQQLPVRTRESQEAGGRWLYQIDAALTRMEELVKDFDLRKELGPIYSAVIVPMMQSKAKSFDLMQDLSNHFKATKGTFPRSWRRSLNETIPQDFIFDPYTQAPLDMTRENLIQIMLNWGNRSNIEKFTRGYASLELGRLATKEEAAAFELRVKDLIDHHARPEDWQFVQRMWEPFKRWQPMIDTVSRNTSGIAPKWIAPEAVQTPHGVFEGGYWPVKYDRLGSDISVIEDRHTNAQGIFGPNYFRAATAKGYLKERTGYVDFVDINSSIEQAAGVMQQTIHDIAFRDALIQASKVFYDKPIRAAIRKHYGVEYEAQLIPWLKRIANQYSTDQQGIQGINNWLRRVRVNLIGHALPLNLKVIGSPDIGVPNPKAWATFEANRSENIKFAMEHSNEIRHLVYNMDRDFREQLERAVKVGTWDSFQAKAVEWGFVPVMKVSQEFRVATFVDQYQKAKGRGLSDFEAAQVADAHVRERHGAASIVDLPAVMEAGEAMKAVTMFYGYFNTMYNWQRQLPGNLRRGEVKNFMVNTLGSVIVGAAFGAALFNQAKEEDSWFKIMAKALIMQPLQTVPILREAASLFMEGYPSRTPTESVFSAFRTLSADVVRKYEGKPMRRPVQNLANVVGLSTGLPLAQIGRTGQFLYDVNERRQRPRNLVEWVRGIIHGEARLKK